MRIDRAPGAHRAVGVDHGDLADIETAFSVRHEARVRDLTGRGIGDVNEVVGRRIEDCHVHCCRRQHQCGARARCDRDPFHAALRSRQRPRVCLRGDEPPQILQKRRRIRAKVRAQNVRRALSEINGHRYDVSPGGGAGGRTRESAAGDHHGYHKARSRSQYAPTRRSRICLGHSLRDSAHAARMFLFANNDELDRLGSLESLRGPFRGEHDRAGADAAAAQDRKSLVAQSPLESRQVSGRVFETAG